MILIKKYSAILNVLVFCVLFSTQALAQTTPPLHLYANNTNAWFMYFGDHKLSDKWGIHLEAQIRRSDFVTNWQQLLLRTGVNYHFSKQVFGTVGYCFVETYPYGEFPAKTSFPEHRIWEQIQVKNQLSNIELVSRFRLEQRFVNAPVLNNSSALYEPGDAVYTNRFRLLNRISIPFSGKSIEDKTFYATAYDELFVNVGQNVAANFFDQNRAYLAVGYKIPNVGRLEVGYMLQNVFKPDGIKIENNNTLQVGLSSNIDFYKKEPAKN